MSSESAQQPDPFSTTAYYVEAKFADTVLSKATAFSMKVDRGKRLAGVGLPVFDTYLITNWHVVSGRHPITGQPLASNGGVPDTLDVYTPVRGGDRSKPISLYDENGEPIWQEHPILRRNVDVAAIKVASSSEFEICAINNQPQNPIKLSSGKDVYILGYPFGITVGSNFPIWKRASIASEPYEAIDDLPKFLVDTATRQGMSGAPTIIRSWNSYEHEDGSAQMGTGAFTKLVGVYSGRIGVDEDELNAQLGVIWNYDALFETILNGVNGSIELP